MSHVIAELRAERYPIDAEAVAALTPTHLNCLRRCTLDVTRVPFPMGHDLRSSRRGANEFVVLILYQVARSWQEPLFGNQLP